MKPVLHCVSLPHTQTTTTFDWCAYSAKCRKFATMMTHEGYRVYLYAGKHNDAECEECIPCVPTPRSNRVVEPEWTTAYFDKMNQRVIKAMRKRIEPRDIICVIGGNCQQPIAEAFPNHMCCEFGIGYQGTFAPYRVFESYAWMHAVYAWQQGAPMSANGKFYDAVIPNYFEKEQFPAGKGNGGYLLFMARLIERKGIQVAIDISKRTGIPLVVAGQGTPPDHGEYVGVVGPEERAKLLGGAIALLSPTLYVEPFGGVAVEAQMCGTPAITTDWGAYPETVQAGVTGFRCHTLAEFCTAAEAAPTLDRKVIRKTAQMRYSTDVIRKDYDHYFERLGGLWSDGWYA